MKKILKKECETVFSGRTEKTLDKQSGILDYSFSVWDLGQEYPALSSVSPSVKGGGLEVTAEAPSCADSRHLSQMLEVDVGVSGAMQTSVPSFASSCPSCPLPHF